MYTCVAMATVKTPWQPTRTLDSFRYDNYWLWSIFQSFSWKGSEIFKRSPARQFFITWNSMCSIRNFSTPAPYSSRRMHTILVFLPAPEGPYISRWGKSPHWTCVPPRRKTAKIKSNYNEAFTKFFNLEACSLWKSNFPRLFGRYLSTHKLIFWRERTRAF